MLQRTRPVILGALLPAMLLAAVGLAQNGQTVPVPAPANSTSWTTVILLRHAEKASATAEDPKLSAAGRRRAKHLAQVLGEAGVEAIYATPYRRTQETAQPLAQRLGLTVATLDAGPDYGPTLAARIRAEHRGQVVVAVSHSNRVPEAIRALGIADVPTIEDNEFDDLYVVTLSENSAHLLALRYGEPTP